MEQSRKRKDKMEVNEGDWGANSYIHTAMQQKEK